MENEFKNGDVGFGGGSGDSLTNAVVIKTKNHFDGVSAEKVFISRQFGREGSDWFFDSQKLLFVDGKAFDLITFSLANGSMKQIYFDISEFFGKF